MNKPLSTLVFFTVLTTTSMCMAAPTASIDQLKWMTGNWIGNVGPNQLEENWTAVEGKSLMASVRMTGRGATSMYEVIIVEEVDGSLILHLQQWDSGFKPRTPTAMKMELTEITADGVSFRNVSGFGMPTLKYRHPDDETFVIHVGRDDGGTFDITLKARPLP